MTNLEITHARIAADCARIASYFKETSGPRVTIIVRNRQGDGTYHSRGSMLVSDDDITEVIESLEYLKETEKIVPNEAPEV